MQPRIDPSKNPHPALSLPYTLSLSVAVSPQSSKPLDKFAQGGEERIHHMHTKPEYNIFFKKKGARNKIAMFLYI